MDSFLPGYNVDDATWFYLSLLLIAAVFFRFGRIWSLRNFDLLLLLSIAPGLLLAAGNDSGVVTTRAAAGYVWLFVVTGGVLVRVLLDSAFLRRPKLPQNMNLPGLAFLCVAAGIFLGTKAVTEQPPASTVEEVRRAQQLIQGAEVADAGHSEAGPASRLLTAATAAIISGQGNHPAADIDAKDTLAERRLAATLAILAHVAVLAGLLMLGHQTFGDLPTGLAMATLYLLLPCTAYDFGKINQVLPAAFIVWACVAHRRPFLSGCLLALACGSLFFPVFLLPLWVVYYGRRGGWRFTSAVVLTGAALSAVLAFVTDDASTFLRQTFGEIDWWMLQFREVQPGGFWSVYPAVYRIPVFVTFLVLLVALCLWPRTKNLGDLMAHSAAIVIATQFWYPQQGGIYVLWYLPLLLMVMFRPALHNVVPKELPPLWRFTKVRKLEESPVLVRAGDAPRH